MWNHCINIVTEHNELLSNTGRFLASYLAINKNTMQTVLQEQQCQPFILSPGREHRCSYSISNSQTKHNLMMKNIYFCTFHLTDGVLPLLGHCWINLLILCVFWKPDHRWKSSTPWYLTITANSDNQQIIFCLKRVLHFKYDFDSNCCQLILHNWLTN